MTTATFRKTWIELAKTMEWREFVVKYVEAFTATAADREMSEGWRLTRKADGWHYGPVGKEFNWVPTIEKAFDMIRRSPLSSLWNRANDDRIWVLAGK